MRIVIEIDQTDSGAESGARSSTATVHVAGADAKAPASAPATTLAEAPATAPSVDPMSTDAGAAASLTPDIASELPAGLLARAAALNALEAGPAPDLAVDLAVVTVVTEADSPRGVSALGGEWAFAVPPSNLEEAVYEGGVTNAGSAPA